MVLAVVLAVLIIFFTLFLTMYGPQPLILFCRTFPRDIRGGIALFGGKYFMYKCKKRNATVAKLFSELAAKYPQKVAFYFKDEVWTYEQLEHLSNKVANCFTEMGYNPGDEVALLMNSRPEFVGIWLGLAKAGIVTAFINTNQRMHTLVHSITVVNCKAVIFDAQLAQSIHEILSLMAEKNNSMQYFSYGDITNSEYKTIPSKSLNELMKDSSIDEPINMAKGNLNDKLYYIFTSGTTGLPKAAVIRNHRYIWLGLIVRRLYKFRKSDIHYITLPLYHNNAGTIATAQTVLFGTAIALREKFSASQFWTDCIKYNCTGAMYIGEICRYLIAQPEKETDKQHNVRIMFGNGLRAQIWSDFKKRFNIERIGEFYGSTEGNANVANYDTKEGACGIIPCCIPFLCRLIYPISIIKVNPQTGEHIRDENGLCIPAKPGEVGEIVAKIHNDDPAKAYPGYASDEATKKKILCDVFKHGDKVFLSGDLMEIDELGFIFFKDRTGDTFRWKGENVSTNEVEAILQKITKHADCVVFGVNINNCEGKAGMAVVAAKEEQIELKSIAQQLIQHLPQYAVPIFLRLTNTIELTGSFKLLKNTLEKDGFNPNVVKDKLFFLDRKLNTYVRLDSNLYNQIQSAQIPV